MRWIYENFGKRLKEAREEKKKIDKTFTQEGMAKKIPVESKTYKNWEQGLVVPPMDKIIILCNILDKSPDYFFSEYDVMSTPEYEVIHGVTGLSEDAIKALRRYGSAPGFIDIINAVLTDRDTEELLQRIGMAVIYQYNINHNVDELLPRDSHIPGWMLATMHIPQGKERMESAYWSISQAASVISRNVVEEQAKTYRIPEIELQQVESFE